MRAATRLSIRQTELRRRQPSPVPYALPFDAPSTNDIPSLPPMHRLDQGSGRDRPRRLTKAVAFTPAHPSITGLAYNTGGGIKWHCDNGRTEESRSTGEELRPHLLVSIWPTAATARTGFSVALVAWLKSQLERDAVYRESGDLNVILRSFR
ncbi:hypothetical protein FKW77_004281 [Venturia effusa]|uniref:Uncharacterized protein n=1 Tax=Venturia effusa TaxID=50376 RepID=A0A517L566_9PEZI|nr:hypothetical protein FKW77_004281 [Venturia effusa]